MAADRTDAEIIAQQKIDGHRQTRASPTEKRENDKREKFDRDVRKAAERLRCRPRPWPRASTPRSATYADVARPG